MTIECTTCGSVGEENFSKNDDGDLVCELCGTQSFLQNRNETNELDDALGMTKSGEYSVKQRRRVRVKKIKEKDSIKFIDCMKACQIVLQMQADALMNQCDLPSIFPNVCRNTWFSFLRAWDQRGERPLYRCFLDYIVKLDKLDPEILSDEDKDWDCSKRTFFNDRIHGLKDKSGRLINFRLIDLISICHLSCRVLSLGISTCHIANLINDGKIPFYSSYILLPKTLRERIRRVRRFFSYDYRVSPADINLNTYIQISAIGIPVPSFNVSATAYYCIKSIGLPDAVFHIFQRLIGVSEPKIGPIVGRSYIESLTGIIAHLLVAIRLCPSWIDWSHIHHQRNNVKIPWGSSSFDRLQWGSMDQYLEFCEQNIRNHSVHLPRGLEDHVKDLYTFGGEIKHNDKKNEDSVVRIVDSFLPFYYGGILSMQQQSDRENVPFSKQSTYCYPKYNHGNKVYHSALEAILRRMCEWADISTELVTRDVLLLDSKLLQYIRDKKQTDCNSLAFPEDTKCSL